MIHTNNIEQTAKTIENKLNKTLGSTLYKIFVATHIETEKQKGILNIQIGWSMNFDDLNYIKGLIGNFYITKSTEEGYLTEIWTTYEKEGE